MFVIFNNMMLLLHYIDNTVKNTNPGIGIGLASPCIPGHEYFLKKKSYT